MFHVICTRLHPGHLSIHVGDGSLRSEETVKIISPLNAIIIIISLQQSHTLTVGQSVHRPCPVNAEVDEDSLPPEVPVSWAAPGAVEAEVEGALGDVGPVRLVHDHPVQVVVCMGQGLRLCDLKQCRRYGH